MTNSEVVLRVDGAIQKIRAMIARNKREGLDGMFYVLTPQESMYSISTRIEACLEEEGYQVEMYDIAMTSTPVKQLSISWENEMQEDNRVISATEARRITDKAAQMEFINDRIKRRAREGHGFCTVDVPVGEHTAIIQILRSKGYNVVDPIRCAPSVTVTINW